MGLLVVVVLSKVVRIKEMVFHQEEMRGRTQGI